LRRPETGGDGCRPLSRDCNFSCCCCSWYSSGLRLGVVPLAAARQGVYTALIYGGVCLFASLQAAAGLTRQVAKPRPHAHHTQKHTKILVRVRVRALLDGGSYGSCPCCRSPVEQDNVRPQRDGHGDGRCTIGARGRCERLAGGRADNARRFVPQGHVESKLDLQQQ